MYFFLVLGYDYDCVSESGLHLYQKTVITSHAIRVNVRMKSAVVSLVGVVFNVIDVMGEICNLISFIIRLVKFPVFREVRKG